MLSVKGRINPIKKGGVFTQNRNQMHRYLVRAGDDVLYFRRLETSVISISSSPKRRISLAGAGILLSDL